MKNTTKVLSLSGLLFLIAMTTAVYSMAKPVPPSNVISKEKAEAIALSAYAGNVKESELELEKIKTWVYSFEIIGADKKEHEITVNALTGEIIESEDDREEREEAEEAEEKEHRG